MVASRAARRPGDAGGDAPGGEGGGESGGDEPGGATTGPYGDPVRIHREYVERHVGGGDDPSSDRYRDAVEAWNRLPGAVPRPPLEVPSEDADETDTDGGTTS